MGYVAPTATTRLPELAGSPRPNPDPAAEEQAVLVTLDLGAADGLDATALAASVDKVILAERTGELDGVQARGADVTLFAYGADAERLWGSMRATVSRFPHRSGTVTLRYGLCGASERRLPI